MASLTNALHELREQRKQAQLHVEKLDQAISVIQSLNGSGTSHQITQPKRIISSASRRKMALAQKARWERAKNGSKAAAAAAKPSALAPAKHTISAAGRRRIAAFQRARWAKIRAKQKKAA